MNLIFIVIQLLSMQKNVKENTVNFGVTNIEKQKNCKHFWY